MAGECKPSTVWTGSEHGLVWTTCGVGGNNNLHFLRVSENGNPIGSPLQLTNSNGNSLTPSLVWNGSEYGLSWMNDKTGDFEIYFTRLSEEGNQIGNEIQISQSPHYSGNPSLVWNGSEYGLAWCDEGSGSTHFIRLSPEGNQYGGEIDLNGYARCTGHGPSLVWADDKYGVAWHNYFVTIGCEDNN
jgi:hypothetical protein